MSEEIPIHIHRAIIHKVDHKRHDQALLTDLESPLSSKVRSFLKRHIHTSVPYDRYTYVTLEQRGG